IHTTKTDPRPGIDRHKTRHQSTKETRQHSTIMAGVGGQGSGVGERDSQLITDHRPLATDYCEGIFLANQTTVACANGAGTIRSSHYWRWDNGSRIGAGCG